MKYSYDIIELSAKDLAIKTFTSKSSVFRFCKKLGVNGYDQLKRRLERELNEESRMLALLGKEPVNKDSSLKDITSIIPSIYDTAISKTKMLLDYDVLHRVIQQIKKSDKIDIYSGGITNTCATAATFKFLSIGIDCTAHTNVNEHYIISSRDKKIIAILLSFTGNNPTIIRFAKYLKRYGIYILGIGGNDASELKSLCNEYIEIYHKTLILSMEVLTPFISITYIIDVLFSSLIISDFDKNVENAKVLLKNEYI